MNNDYNLYSGRWIALIDDRVVGQGGTPEQALQAAAIARYKETARVKYVPTKVPLTFSSYLPQICDLIPKEIYKYLVGGAIRDALLNKPIHDYDIILSDKCVESARKVADRLGGIFFLLDDERETARVILKNSRNLTTTFDFARIRGTDLEKDLKDRDFTINAIASRLDEPDKLLDPLAGSTDLYNGVLRTCSNTSIVDDPVRILRAIRLAAGYDLKILPKTRSQLEDGVPFLENVSPERLRDELFRILDGPNQAKSILALELIGSFPNILPELIPLNQTPQSAPHIRNAWQHTLDTLNYLEKLLLFLNLDDNGDLKNPKKKTHLDKVLQVLDGKLGEFRENISSHLEKFLVDQRTTRSLLFFASLYHDSAKPLVKTVDENGRIRFFNHEEIGSDLIKKRASALRLSNLEINHLGAIVKGHMRPTHLARLEQDPSARAIYRFFRDTGERGIDICLLSLADLLATYGLSIPEKRWVRQLDVVNKIFKSWWQENEAKVRPEPLIRGGDLLRELDLEPGPVIGRLLEMIREEQVEGNLKSYDDAIRFIKRTYKGDRENSNTV